MPLWNRFLDRYGDGWGEFAYDVRVGDPSQAARGQDAQAQAVWADLTRLRIDAVGFAHNAVTVFEVKPYAGIGTVGQLLGYRRLYAVAFKPAVAVRMGVVTDRFVPAVGQVFKGEGIEVWIV